MEQAEKLGLKEVGISDHGLRHMAFGMKTNEIFKVRSIIDDLQPNYSVRILFGIETNNFSSDGDVDLRNVERGYFDYIIAGYHKAVWAKNFKDMFLWTLPAMCTDYFGCTQAQKKRYTQAYVKAVKTQKIDIISHLCLGIPVDVVEVGKACVDYNVFIELNGKRVVIPDEDILKLQDLGVKFIVDSDAHSPDRVGDVSVPLQVVERLQLKKEQIANWEKLPTFTNQRKIF